MKVILVMALTLDGKIARNEAHFPDWTGRADKRMFKSVSTAAGAVIMGSKTFDVIGKPLPGRKNVVLTRNADRVSVWDNLVYTHDSPGEIVRTLSGEGFSSAVLVGGAQINTLFARERLIDEFLITYSPIVFGTGIPLFSETVDLRLTLLEVSNLDQNTICVRYGVLK